MRWLWNCVSRYLSPGAYNHGVLKAYRFVDPKLEAQYQRGANQWHVFISRCHGAFLSFWFASMAAYYGATEPMSRVFWSAVARAALALLFLAAVLLVAGVKRWVVPIHAAFCVAVGGLLIWMTEAEMVETQAAFGASWLPVVGTALDAKNARQKFASDVGAIIEDSFRRQLSTYNHWQFIALAFVGFTHITAAAVVAIPVAVITVGCLDEYVTPSGLSGLLADNMFASVAFLFLGICMEKLRRNAFLNQNLLSRELHNSQASDSILNHTLKNTLADGASNIELFLKHELGADDSLLADAVVALRRGIKACRARQTYLKLVSGNYVPTFTPTNLRDFGNELIAGRRVKGTFIQRSVMLDQTLVNLIVDNAIHNAVKHGCPTNPDVHFSIHEEEAHPDTPEGHMPLVIRVTNRARQDRPPLSPDFVTKAFAGAPTLRCYDVPALSDQIGLSHCSIAANAHDIRLSLSQDGDIVSFTALAIVKVALTRLRTSSHGSSPDIDAFPCGLRFYLIDDSVASLRLMVSQLTHGAAPGEVKAFGRHEEEIAPFVADAMRFADVVICDQNLEYGAHSYYGSDIVAQLRDGGFPGLLCIRSANMCPADVQLYRASGAHCTLGKDLTAKQFIHGIKSAYLALPRTVPPCLPSRMTPS